MSKTKWHVFIPQDGAILAGSWPLAGALRSEAEALAAARKLFRESYKQKLPRNAKVYKRVTK